MIIKLSKGHDTQLDFCFTHSSVRFFSRNCQKYDPISNWYFQRSCSLCPDFNFM